MNRKVFISTILTLVIFCSFSAANAQAPTFAYGGVSVAHANCSVTNYPALSDTDVGRGDALLLANSNHENGDVYYLTTGTFDIGTGFIDLSRVGGYTGLGPNSITGSIHGSGKTSTVITSSKDSGDGTAVLVPGNDSSQTTDLTIDQTSSTYTNPWGVNSFTGHMHNTWIVNVAMNGYVDGIHYYTNSGDSDLTVINTTINSNYDTINIGDNHGTLNIYDSSFTNSSTQAGFYDRALVTVQQTVNIWGSTFTSLASSRSYGLYVVGGTVNLYSGSANGQTYDIFTDGTVNYSSSFSFTTSSDDNSAGSINGGLNTGDGESVPSVPSQCSVSAPGIVDGLSATISTLGTVVLSWNTPTNTGPAITDYDVEYRLYNNGSWSPAVHSPSTATSTTLSGLLADHIYEFEVAAVNDIGTSTMSDPVQFADDIKDTYVDPAFTSDSNSYSKFFGINTFNTIQPAIDAVIDGGQVNLASSTYSEHLNVNKSITFYPETSNQNGLGTTVHLIAPDCETPLITITTAETVLMEGMEVDQNDSSHVCTNPMISLSPNAEFVSLINIFENANVAIEASATSTSINAVSDFINVGTAVRSDSPLNLIYDPVSYWGGDSGPYQSSTNPSGNGVPIDGLGSASAYFRPYLTADFNNSTPVEEVLDTVPYNQIQSLFGNGGTIIPFATSSSFIDFVLAPVNNTPTIVVTEPVTISVPANASSSTIYIAGQPAFFGSGLTLVAHDSNSFDATQIMATTTVTSSVAGLPDGASAQGTVLQFGIPGRQLDVTNGDSILISMYVGDSFNDQTMDIYRSESLTNGWTQDGLVDATCVVSSGYCSFSTNSLSYFAVSSVTAPVLNVVTPPVSSSGGGSSGGSALSQYNNLVAMGQTDAANKIKAQYPWVSISTFTRYLALGSVGNDVKALQVFLNTHGFVISAGGAGSVGHETTAFGLKTMLALKKFQEAHADIVLVPQGLKHGNGRFGPATMKLVNSMVGK